MRPKVGTNYSLNRTNLRVPCFFLKMMIRQIHLTKKIKSLSRTKQAVVKLQMCLKFYVNYRLIFSKKNILTKFDGQSRFRVSLLGQRGSVGQKVSIPGFCRIAGRIRPML